MVMSYKDRLEGGYRYVRIRRIRAWTTAGLILGTSGLIAVALADSGASAKPLFMPVEGFLPPLLVMFLIGIILQTFFRNLSIKYAKKDSQRYLMTKGSMARGKWIVAISIVIAVILFAPSTRGAADASATPPPTRATMDPAETILFSFNSQDGLGVTRYTALTITLESGTKLDLAVKRIWTSEVTDVGGPPSVMGAGRSVSFTIDTNKVYTYVVTLTNPTAGPIGYAYQLRGAAFPALFTVVPGVAVALAILSLLFFLYLRPRREKYKQAAVYSGELSLQVDSGERLYSEYQRTRPGRRTFLEGNSPPATPPPAPAVSQYVPPPSPTGPAVQPPPASAPPSPPSPPRVPAPPPPTPSDLFAEGASLFSRGAFEPAVRKFDQVVILDPRHTRALLGKAEALLRLGETGGALGAYDQILRYDRGNLDALLGTAAVYSAERRWRDVIDLADTFLAMQPGEPEMLVHRGDAQFALGKRSEAQISYEAALQKRPGDETIITRIEKTKVDIAGLQSRAFIASASGNLDQAVSFFDEVLRLEPENANALVGKSVALRRAGRVGDALASLNAVLARSPGHGGALLNKGRILEERGDLEDALEAYDKLIELNPMDPDAWVAQGDVLAKMGRDEEAAKSYGEALKISPTDEDTKGKLSGLDAARVQESLLLRELFQVKGIGPAKMKALRDAGFRTVQDFKNATEDALAEVRGVTRKVASDIVRHFQSVQSPDAQA